MCASTKACRATKSLHGLSKTAGINMCYVNPQKGEAYKSENYRPFTITICTKVSKVKENLINFYLEKFSLRQQGYWITLQLTCFLSFRNDTTLATVQWWLQIFPKRLKEWYMVRFYQNLLHLVSVITFLDLFRAFSGMTFYGLLQMRFPQTFNINSGSVLSTLFLIFPN